MSDEFADANVVLYPLDSGPKADRAEVILGQGTRISVQVLNETLLNCRRKARPGLGEGWGTSRGREPFVSRRGPNAADP
jgi:hypothetical protein